MSEEYQKRTKKTILTIELNILKELEKDLNQMNIIKPIDFGFVLCVIWEHITGKEFELEKINNSKG